MIGGLLAGAGALAGGAIIAGQSAYNAEFRGNRELRSAEEIAKSNDRTTKAIDRVAEANNHIAANIDKLNGTFDDEFNNREKRLVNISLVDEDEEPVKLSKYFNQPPLFKEDLRTSFYRDPDTKSSVDTLNAIYKGIEEEPNIKEALDILKRSSYSYYSNDFMPPEILEDLFYVEACQPLKMVDILALSRL